MTSRKAEMHFGAMLLADPPARRLVALARRAEAAGYDSFWLNDAPTHYEDPWPVFALIAEATERIKIGTMVTNPVLRDWSCVAGALATLDEISDGRMVVGIGRGDIAVRAVGRRGASIAELGRFAEALRELVGGRAMQREGEPEVRLAWSQGWPLEVWGAAYGPQATKVVGATCHGCIVQSADVALARWVAGNLAAGAREAGRDGRSVALMVGAPAYVSADVSHAHDEVRWFSTMVAEHMGQLVHRGGDDVPAALRGLVARRVARSSLEHAASEDIADELNARNCLIGPADVHVRRLQELAAVGVGGFTAYLSHDAPEETIDAYGSEVIPKLRAAAVA